MPKFTIIETIVERRVVEADSAQEALDIWLNFGTDHPSVRDESCAGVDERTVEDADGNECEVEDS